MCDNKKFISQKTIHIEGRIIFLIFTDISFAQSMLEKNSKITYQSSKIVIQRQRGDIKHFNSENGISTFSDKQKIKEDPCCLNDDDESK